MRDNTVKAYVRARACDLSQPADYLRLLAAQLLEMDVDVAAWLARGGLSTDMLTDASAVVPVATFRRLVADALASTREPALGLLVGQRMVIHSHAALGAAAQACRSLRAVLALLVHFIALRTPLVALRVVERRAELRLVCRERLVLGAIRRPVLEAIVLALKNVLDFLALGARPVSAVSLAFEAPRDRSLSDSIWQCPQHYGSRWNGLSIPMAAVDRPLHAPQIEDFQRAAAVCAQELERLAERDSYSARVRALLLDHGTGGFPSFATVARLMNRSPRTLHRQLIAEGSAYRDVLESVRHQLAVQHLTSGRLSVQATAWALGYSDVANFRRAFRRWTGGPPSTLLRSIRHR